MHLHPGVDFYFERLPEWQQRVCREVRELLHEADPDMRETIKRTVQPYFTVEDRNVAALQGTKDHVNVFVYDPIAPDPAGLVNRPPGKTGRQIAIYEDDQLDRDGFLELIRGVCANNRAGGWRKLTQDP